MRSIKLTLSLQVKSFSEMKILEFPIFKVFDNNNNFTNISVPVLSAAGIHGGYQHAQRMGGPSDGSYSGNPRFGNYHVETQNTTFHDTNLIDFPPPPPFVPLPSPDNTYTSNVSPPHHPQDSRHFIHDRNVRNLDRLLSIIHKNRYAYSPYHPNHAISGNYNSSYLNNVRDGMGDITLMQHYGNNSPQYPPTPPTHLQCHVGRVTQSQTFLTCHNYNISHVTN